jgi:hypothetical protein
MSIIRLKGQKHFVSLKGLYIVSHDAENLTKRLHDRSINNLDKEAGPPFILLPLFNFTLTASKLF